MLRIILAIALVLLPSFGITPSVQNDHGYIQSKYEFPTKWHWYESEDNPIFEHISYLYTDQTEITDSLDTSKLTKAESEFNDRLSYADLTPVDDRSVVLSFTAPEDGTYNLDFAYSAGCTDNEISDGVAVLVFAENKLLYSMEIDNGLREGETFTLNTPLRAGECVYFVADPRETDDGDYCIGKFDVTKQADVYIDNVNAWGFGLAYNNGSDAQGVNGWYAGYADGSSIDSIVFNNESIPKLMAKGWLFGENSDKEKDFKTNGVVIREAPRDGKYAVRVTFACSPANGEQIGTTFAAGDSVIATKTITDYEYNNYVMTVDLKKGEAFTFAVSTYPTARFSLVTELEMVIEEL